MFVILEVSKQWIFFIFPLSLYSNIRSWILLLFINSLSEPHVSEHVDPSIGRKVTVGDDVGPRLTVGGDVGDDEGVTVGGNDTVGGDVGDDERVTVGDDDTVGGDVGGDVLAIRGSEHSPHSTHTSLA